jgi:FixJ family two-component response regulator
MSSIEPTVFVVDDDPSVRGSLQELMGSVPLAARVFASAQEFLETYEPDWQGCLLLDVRMPGMSGLRLQEELNRRGGDLPIIFVTGHGDVSMAVETLHKGAFDFLEKPVRGQVVIEKVQQALERNRQRQQAKARVANLKARLALLTRRETDILTHVRSGKRTKQISHECGLSRKTIDAHLTSIREKLGVETTAQMLVLLCESDHLRATRP